MSSWTTWTAGGWSGSFGGLDDCVEQVAERHQVRDGNYNAGAHYGGGVNRSLKHRAGVWPYVCKRERGKIASDRDIELSITYGFWDIVRVCYGRGLRLIGQLFALRRIRH